VKSAGVNAGARLLRSLRGVKKPTEEEDSLYTRFGDEAALPN